MTHEESVRYLGIVMDYNRSVQMKYSRGRRFPIISIATTDIRAGNLLIETFGGTLRKARGYYAFQRSHAKAIEIIKQIRPFMYLCVEVAEEALQWKPVDRAEWMQERAPDGTFRWKVPCPNCGKPMTPNSMTCKDCYIQPAPKPVPVVEVPKIVEPVKPPKEVKPAATKPVDPLLQFDLTKTGRGKVFETPTGRIHRMRG